jgi:DNA-binding winged helix-turn-helix (wHTH) protein/tetratricopeptide (TPR) repeat protein
MAAGERMRYQFDAFCLNAAERQLSRDGAPIALTDKVFDLLLLLVQRPGQLLHKAELMNLLWPDTVVEENNLTVNMSTLRKALGETASNRRFIETVARRGYRFIAKVTALPAAPAIGRADRASDSKLAAEVPSLPGVAFESESPALRSENRVFVGRQRELEFLEQSLMNATSGHGRLVFVAGAPGMGKTALAAQFLNRARITGSTRFTARGRSLEQYGPREAYLPFLEAVRSLLTSSDFSQVAQVLKDHAPTWWREFPSLASGSEGPRIDGRSATPARMLRELCNLLEALSAIKPVLLVLEDLHWADPSSCDLLGLIAERCSDWRVLLVGTFRAEQVELEKHPLRNIERELLTHELCDELTLPLLDRGSVFEYLDQRFFPHRFPPELAELVEKTSEGQPLFLTRLVELLVQRGDIALDQRSFHVARPVSELKLGVPDTIRGLIERKLESLSDPERRTLEYASVLGTEFSSAVAAELLEEDEVSLEERLDELTRAHRLVECLGEERVTGERRTVRYRFAHVLYRTVLYERLASKRRMVLHAKAAEALLERGNAQQLATQLAIHFEAARSFERAIFYLMQAADNASRLHANREAVEHYARALGLLTELDSEQQVARSIILRYNLGWCRFNAGFAGQAQRDFEALLREASTPPFISATDEGARIRAVVFDYFAQPWRDAFGLYEMARMPNQDRSMGAEAIQCEAYWALCFILHATHQLEAMGARATEYLTRAETSHNLPRRAEALAWSGGRELAMGNLSGATSILEESTALSRSLGHTRAFYLALSDRARIHQLVSEFERAELAWTECLDLTFEASGRIMCLRGLGLARTQLGRISSALSAFQEAREIAEQTGQDDHRQSLCNAVGAVYLELGDWSSAAPHFEQGVELARKHDLVRDELRSWIDLARSQCGLGDLAAAKSSLQRVEELERKAAARHSPPRAERRVLPLLWAKAEYCERARELPQAEVHAQALLLEATRVSSPRYMAIARHLLGYIRLDAGQFEAAQRELEAGLDALGPRTAPLVRWKLLASLGAVRRRTGAPRLSAEAYREAQEIIEQIAHEIEDAKARAAWFESKDVSQVRSVFPHHDLGDAGLMREP